MAYIQVCKCKYNEQGILLADCRGIELDAMPIFNSEESPDVLFMQGTSYCQSPMGLLDTSCQETGGMYGFIRFCFFFYYFPCFNFYIISIDITTVVEEDEILQTTEAYDKDNVIATTGPGLETARFDIEPPSITTMDTPLKSSHAQTTPDTSHESYKSSQSVNTADSQDSVHTTEQYLDGTIQSFTDENILTISFTDEYISSTSITDAQKSFKSTGPTANYPTIAGSVNNFDTTVVTASLSSSLSTSLETIETSLPTGLKKHPFSLTDISSIGSVVCIFISAISCLYCTFRLSLYQYHRARESRGTSVQTQTSSVCRPLKVPKVVTQV